MILNIDTTEREKICLTLFDKQEDQCFKFETEDQSADLLIAIDGILKEYSSRQARTISLHALTAIIVNRGPGSFTGVRVGVTVANTLAWTLNIPVYGYREGEREALLVKIAKSCHDHFSKIVVPCYENPKS